MLAPALPAPALRAFLALPGIIAILVPAWMAARERSRRGRSRSMPVS
jgi:hypothetical protein